MRKQTTSLKAEKKDEVGRGSLLSGHNNSKMHSVSVFSKDKHSASKEVKIKGALN